MPPLPFRLRPMAALLCVASVTLSAQDPALAERLFRSGERAYTAQDHKAAIETWLQLLQAAPTSPFAPRALLRLARHQVEVELRPEAALPYLDRLRTDYLRSPEAAEGLLLRGVLLMRQARRPADLKDAMAEFNRVLDLFPDAPACANARLQLGLAWREQGQPGRALQFLVAAFRLHQDPQVAASAMLEAGRTLETMGDLLACLRMFQGLRTRFPESPEAAEATWRTAVLVKHRLQKAPLHLEGPWPAGQTKWLKTPTLLATGGNGELLIYQSDLDQTCRLLENELKPAGPKVPGARVLLTAPGGTLWVLTRSGLWRDGATAQAPLGTLGAICGGVLDRWGSLWVADAKTPALTVFPPEGPARTVASPTPSALAALGDGGLVVASDTDRKFLFLDPDGQPRSIVPYGKGLPAAFRVVTALASDGAGQVAALVDGGDYGEGVIILGPDGTVLRQSTLKSLGIGGRITALALDRSGGLLLCDRRNDLLLRVD